MQIFRKVGAETQGYRAHHLTRALLLVCALGSALPAFATSDPKAAKYYEDALIRYEKKDIAGTIIQLKNAMQIDSSMLPVQVLLGKALLANGEVAAAEAALTEALRLGVSRNELVVLLAEAYIGQGKQQQLLTDAQFRTTGLLPATQVQLLLLRAAASGDLGKTDDAMQAIAEARNIDPTSVNAVLAEIPVRIRARQLSEARVAAERALTMAPNSAEAWYQKGAVLHMGNALTEAAAAYDKSIQLNPSHSEARVARIGLHMDFGRSAEAAADIAELHRISPIDPRAAYLKALLAERNKQPEEAKAALHEVTALIDPVPPEFIRYRPQTLMLNGLAHLGLNEADRALPYLESFQRAQGISPVTKLLAQIYLGNGDSGKAIALLEPYLRAHPSDGQALSLLAAVYMAKGNHAQATRLMQEALNSQDSPQMQATMGLSLLGSGRPGDATTHLQTAFRIDPGQTQVGTALVGLYLRSNQAAKAVGIAETMLKRQPESAGLNNLMGMTYAAAGNAAAARRAYEKAIQIDHQLNAPRINLARLDMAGKDFAAAAQRLNAMLKENDRDPEVLFEQAVLAERQAQPVEAQRWLEKAANAEGRKTIRALLALASLHLRLGQPEPALEAAKRATSKQPEDFTALTLLATAYLLNGQAADARSVLNTATKIAEYNAPMLVRVAGLQLSAKDLSGASYSLNKALAGNADHLPAIAMLADIDIAKGEFDQAERQARRLIEKAPRLAAGPRLLGDIATAKGQGKTALEAYRRAYQLEPSAGTLLKVFGSLLGQDNGKPAIQLAEQWLKQHPNDGAVLRALANTHARSGNFTAARKSYESLLKLAPEDAGTMNNLANILLRLKDPGALKIAESAVAKAPGNADFIDTLGWILLQDGQNERALALLRDARLRNPANAEIRYHLAEALFRSNRRNEARDELQAALNEKSNYEGRSSAEKLLLKLN
jgi:cellulose synthase operon protein C